MLPAGGLVLDLGGTRHHKRGQFDIERYDLDVVYANLSVAKGPDVRTDASALPFRGCVFDGVICAELLEHVPQPPVVLEQAHRVLRSGGTLLATVPFLFRVHGDPEDYGRYTAHYWTTLLDDLGFQDVEVVAQGGFWAVVADFAKQYAGHVGWAGVAAPLARRLLPRFVDWALHRDDDTGHHDFLRSFTTGYGISARKA